MILIIDDQVREMNSYTLELELSGYEVLCKSSVDEAWLYFENNSNHIELCIIDLMMPSGSIFKDTDTQKGLRTGISFYRKVREISTECAIIIFTKFSEMSASKGFEHDKKCLYLGKEGYLPFELVEVVRKFLGP